MRVKQEKHSRKHRNKLEMIADVLKKCRDGDLKTHVMYGCNFSYSQLVVYLNLCTTKGWLKRRGNLYLTTFKGKAFLKKVGRVLKILQEAETAYERALKTVSEAGEET